MTNVLLFLDSPFHTMKLRQALDATRQMSSITVARDMIELKELIRSGTEFDIIFLRGQISSQWVSDLVSALREETMSYGASIVLVTSEVDKGEFSFAQNLLGKGRIDGVLLEPFSVESLLEVVSIAQHAPRKLSDSTMRKILKILVREVCDQITLIAKQLSHGGGARVGRTVLKETVAIVNELPEQYQILFHEYLSERCEKAKPAQRKIARQIPLKESRILPKQTIYRTTKAGTIR